MYIYINIPDLLYPPYGKNITTSEYPMTFPLIMVIPAISQSKQPLHPDAKDFSWSNPCSFGTYPLSLQTRTARRRSRAPAAPLTW